MKTITILLVLVLAYLAVGELQTCKNTQVHNPDFDGIWEKVKCMFKCLKENIPMQKLLQIVLKCKTDLNCYKTELGEEAMKCAAQCMKEEEVRVHGIWEKVKCMFKCLKENIPMQKLLQIVLKCKTDVNCYKTELGEEAMKCAAQCMKEDAEVDGIWEKVKCMFKCLKENIPMQKLLQIVLKCKTDLNCYKTELGEEAMKCAAQCMKEDVEVDGIWEKVKCMFKCLKENIPMQKLLQIVLKCKTDLNCYKTELGEEAMKCAAQCMKKEEPEIEGLWEKVKCMFKCLKQNIPMEKLLQIVLKCKTDLTCYKTELGEEAMKCAAQCMKEKPNLEGVWEKVKCMFNCLKKSVPMEKLLQVVLKCKTDLNCYKTELGEEAMKCAAQCVKTETVETKSCSCNCNYEQQATEIVTVYGKAKCIFDCLKGRVSLPKILGLILKCKTNWACWAAAVGKEGVACAKKCW